MYRNLLLFSLVAAQAAFAAAPALMPLPVTAEPGQGKLMVDANFSVVATAYSGERLEDVLHRFVSQLTRQTGIPILDVKPADPAKATLRVECAAAGPGYPQLGEDEAYTLDVTPDGALIKSATIAGARHGLETFAQLVAPDAGGFSAPAMRIEDRPRFPWRGLMIDVSRHWMPVAVIKRNLDAMAAVKLNVFHWHLSDDQGFRVESKLYPKLQEMGSDGHFYTQDQMRDVVAYARDRGIRVVPEFDIPGHTLSWLVGYPDLTNVPGPFTIGRTWGIFDPVMDPTSEYTYQFLDGFIGEMVQIFPDPFFHIGGDEVNGKVWNASPRIQAFEKEHNLEGAHGLQAYFNQRILKILDKYGKTMVGWDEILHPDLPKAAVIQSWRGSKSLADAAIAGHRGILSSGYYLDHLSPASFHYNNDPLSGPAAELTPEQASMILGGEACIWSEYVSQETVDSRIWPRMAAIAERLWSPKGLTDVDSMYARMERVSRFLDWTGVQHRTGYQPMLDRMSGERPNEPLRVLADASEALGLGPRARAMKYTSLVPLNRFVDAVRPESESVRALEQDAANVAKGTGGEQAAALRSRFTVWAANDAKFQPLAEGNALLEEVKPLSKNLSELGGMGLQALDYLARGGPAPSAWLARQNAELARIAPEIMGARRPNGEVVLAAARPVKTLIDALASRGK
jgi:hexosaminidase